jgi:hypothetical protein
VTSVVVWVGVDSRGPASTYIATDSRFTWSRNSRVETWDQGRKTFRSVRFADIAGFWGDVLFPVVVLSRHFDLLDSGVIAEPDATGDTRFKALEKSLRLSLAEWPKTEQRPFTVIHAARDGASMESQFQIRTIAWSPRHGWVRDNLAIPKTSSAVMLGGSGAGTTQVHLEKWCDSSEGGTSRAVYSAFIDGLLEEADALCGGAPQLVGLYRIGGGRSIGTVIGKKRFLGGAPVSVTASEIEWRNELFERVSPASRRRLSDAHPHKRI